MRRAHAGEKRWAQGLRWKCTKMRLSVCLVSSKSIKTTLGVSTEILSKCGRLWKEKRMYSHRKIKKIIHLLNKRFMSKHVALILEAIKKPDWNWWCDIVNISHQIEKKNVQSCWGVSERISHESKYIWEPMERQKETKREGENKLNGSFSMAVRKKKTSWLARWHPGLLTRQTPGTCKQNLSHR